jgi:hypothetical protein
LEQELSPAWELELMLMLMRSLKEIFGSFSIIILHRRQKNRARMK